MRQLRGDEEPVNTLTILDACREALEDIEDHVVGKHSEADVMEVIRELDRLDIVTECEADTTRAGKRQSTYRLTAAEEMVRDVLAQDDRRTELLEDDQS